MVDGLHRVVITGLGAVTPIGNTVHDYWEGLCSGRNGVESITLFDASAHACPARLSLPSARPCTPGWV